MSAQPPVADSGGTPREYLTVTFNVWHQGGDTLMVATRDERFKDPETGRHGLMFVASSYPRSANYHPNNWNRIVRALKDRFGHAPDEIPVYDRRLKLRNKVVKAVLGATNSLFG